jgi:serine/threonine-protein kinase
VAQQQQRYRVIEKIASGGMAEVFRAESAGLEGFKKVVAIKRVLPHLSEKKKFIGMFLDEARLSAHLSHSNCVQVFDIGVGDNTYFIVMEYVDGCDLKQIIEHKRKQGGPMPLAESLFVCTRLCEGLAYAHGARDLAGHPLGIVHRDMSPPNVLITRNGEVKIVDFGLAKANSQLERSEPGIIKGKFSYLAPEAALGQEVDGRADIFAVGIILWEMLAGRRLFLGDTDLETVRQVQAARVPSLRGVHPEASNDLETVLAGALARDPNDRYQSAADLGRDLTTLLFQTRPVSSFDIADIVNEVVSVHDAQRKAKKLDKGSIIGSLIDQALFEFTSLEPKAETGGGERGGTAGATPLNLGSFENVGNWAEELEDVAPRARPALPSGSQFEEGNLAALEEETGSQRLRAAGGPQRPSQRPAQVKIVQPSPPAEPLRRPTGPTRSTPPPAASVPLVVPPPPAQSKSSLYLMLVIVAVVAALAGAYFGGVIKMPP